jgi:hypothetical protein
MSMTEEQIRVYCEALREERKGYVNRGLHDRVAQVDAEIQRVSGTKPPAHQARATRRPRTSPERETR